VRGARSRAGTYSVYSTPHLIRLYHSVLTSHPLVLPISIVPWLASSPGMEVNRCEVSRGSRTMVAWMRMVARERYR
jgi:hypothetical protein